MKYTHKNKLYPARLENIFTGHDKRALRLLGKLIHSLAVNVNNPKPGYCWATPSTLQKYLTDNYNCNRSLSHIYFLIRRLEKEGYIMVKWINTSAYRYLVPCNPMEKLIRDGQIHAITHAIQNLKQYQEWRTHQGLSKIAALNYLVEFIHFLKRTQDFEAASIPALFVYFRNNYAFRKRKEAEKHEKKHTEGSFPIITSTQQLKRLQESCKTKQQMMSLITWAQRFGYKLVHDSRTDAYIWTYSRPPT